MRLMTGEMCYMKTTQIKSNSHLARWVGSQVTDEKMMGKCDTLVLEKKCCSLKEPEKRGKLNDMDKHKIQTYTQNSIANCLF